MHFPELLDTLLKERGITPEEKDAFLNPDYQKLFDPALLPDMEKARDRILLGIKNNEHIVIFSDYDADGIPGAVVLSDLFKRIGYKNISFYIPHRHDEGFGLNEEAVIECKNRGAKILVTVDCGTADLDEVKIANREGIDVIITDHHEPKSLEAGGLPEAFAVVNPKRRDSIYPFKELCGSAIAFKLVQAILDKESFGIKSGMEKWSLDMVGIATLSDMVPLVSENRIFAKYGLEVLRKSPRPGLAALFRKLNLDQTHLSEDDITFMITPRINAASRMGVPEDAFNLLNTNDDHEAEKLAAHLEKINNERKGVVASLVKDAKKHLSERETISGVIVFGNPEWKPSLLGLVANSLVEAYDRPVFVWGRDGEGMLKGSCRAPDECDLYALMSACPDSFSEFGGHAGAGGFSVTLENLTRLEENLSQAYQLIPKKASEKEMQGNSLAVRLEDLGENLWNIMSILSPFGVGNEKPVFRISGAEIKSMRQFGKENNHLEIELANGIRAISFFSDANSYDTNISPGSSVNLLAHLEKSFFRSRPELRLRIVDIINL